MIILDWYIDVHKYFFYFLVIAIILDKAVGLQISINEFRRKKSENEAKSAAVIWSTFYLIFTGTCLIIKQIYSYNLKMFIIILVILIIQYRLFYKFYFNFQGRKKKTEFRKDFKRIFKI